ncbi:DUF6344 domain-containing protein [Streptomyces sp. NPDC057877]|uniref:DUF6344 domain-containing protein n=1 Tax=Streptomyces sp. NPDC057877 TaxID=3346269 RepID=UPI003697EB4B
MARTKVMKLWNVLVTAFITLFTALGLITTTTAAAVPQSEPTRNSAADHTPPTATPGTTPAWVWSHARALPPTMKQRIRAEAHGKTPSCRHLPVPDRDAEAAQEAGHPCEDETAPEDPEPAASPLHR